MNEERRGFKVLAEESPFGISIISKEGHNSYLNQKFIEMFGYTLEDIPTDREWFLKAYPDEEYRRKVISTWTQDLKDSESGLSRPRTFRVRCSDGSAKIIHFSPVTMTDSG